VSLQISREVPILAAVTSQIDVRRQTPRIDAAPVEFACGTGWRVIYNLSSGGAAKDAATADALISRFFST
jgi:hypothetical protein